MSDYMFNLESHLTAEQQTALSVIQSAASEAGISLYLTGGAMRDMLAGFPIRDLDFTVEAAPAKLIKAITQKGKAVVASQDDHKKTYDLAFPNGIRCEVSMARQEKYGKPGSKPQITPATIHEDLRGRDFTINAIGLSLNRASRGLMIDPTNGAADIERKELRAISNYGLYDDPSRLLRLLRFKIRFDYAVNERTQMSYQNAREAGVEKLIPARTLYKELRQICLERDPLAILQELERENLLGLFVPALGGAKLNAGSFHKVQKAVQQVPFGIPFIIDHYALSMFLLTQLLSPKEKTALLNSTKMEKAEAEPWQKLEAKSKKLELLLKSAKLAKASKIYDALLTAPGEQVLYLHLNSKQKLVQDRIKNYFTKYLPTAVDVSDMEVTTATGLAVTDPKFAKAKEDRIAGRLDGRIKKPAPPPEPPPPPPQSARSPMARGARFR